MFYIRGKRRRKWIDGFVVAAGPDWKRRSDYHSRRLT